MVNYKQLHDQIFVDRWLPYLWGIAMSQKITKGSKSRSLKGGEAWGKPDGKPISQRVLQLQLVDGYFFWFPLKFKVEANKSKGESNLEADKSNRKTTSPAFLCGYHVCFRLF